MFLKALVSDTDKNHHTKCPLALIWVIVGEVGSLVLSEARMEAGEMGRGEDLRYEQFLPQVR